MEIIDKRQATRWFPAEEILAEIIPLLRQEYLRGLRRIYLLDEDYHTGPRGRAIYLPIKGTNSADIELFFAPYSWLPPEAKESRMYLTYLLTHALMHEVYHHVVRTQKRIRRCSSKKEEEKADKWARATVDFVFQKLYAGDEYTSEWDKIQVAIKAARETQDARPRDR